MDVLAIDYLNNIY